MLIVSTKYGFQLKVFTCQSILFYVIASSDLSERGNPRLRLLQSFYSLAMTTHSMQLYSDSWILAPDFFPLDHSLFTND